MDNLVKQMHDYITKKDMRRYELANKLGTTGVNVTRWLNGQAKISKAWRELIKQRLELE